MANTPSKDNQKKRKNKSPWRLYMVGEVGDPGWYINTKQYKFGPFKNKKIAEFFNLIAFGNPSSDSLKEEISTPIKKYKKPTKTEHPSQLFGSNSKFGIWWKYVFENTLTPEMILKLAKETGAQGYESFQDWMYSGCQIDGKHVVYYNPN